ncbi:MAG: electron transfer flavoprotein subunit beta, partial [Faecalibacterium sp.]
KSFTPPQKGAGTMLTGDDTAAQLAGILAKKHLI